MIDEEVDQVLSMASLAHRLGVKPPSLYKNVDGMSGIHRGIMLRAKAARAGFWDRLPLVEETLTWGLTIRENC